LLAAAREVRAYEPGVYIGPALPLAWRVPMDLQILNKICFAICIVCIVVGTVLAISMIWVTYESAFLMKFWSTNGVIFLAAALALAGLSCLSDGTHRCLCGSGADGAGRLAGRRAIGLGCLSPRSPASPGRGQESSAVVSASERRRGGSARTEGVPALLPGGHG